MDNTTGPEYLFEYITYMTAGKFLTKRGIES